MSERRREIAILMIADVVVDVFTEETQSLEAEATSYPVEKGVDITDHIRVMPLRLSVSGVVSDFGLIDYEGEDTLIPSDYARARLEELFNDAGLITVATSRRTYENMAMVSLEISRDSDTGHALLFDAEFQQITTIENTRTIIRVKVPRQGKKKDLGPKATKKGDGKRMAPVDKFGQWYDDDIGEYRDGGQPQPDGTWKLYKGRPVSDYTKEPVKTDAEYRAIKNNKKLFDAAGVGDDEVLGPRDGVTILNPEDFEVVR